MRTKIPQISPILQKLSEQYENQSGELHLRELSDVRYIDSVCAGHTIKNEICDVEQKKHKIQKNLLIIY